MARKTCFPKEGINRGAWTSDEDKLLMNYIALHGLGKWGSIPKKAGLKRCGKSCRLRWLNYLRPDIKRGNITEDEEELIVRLHKLLGNRWSLIAGRIPGRTDNEIKNYWNTCLKKKLMGMNPKQRGRSRARSTPVDKPCSEESTDTIGTNMIHSTVPIPYDTAPGENSEDDRWGCPSYSDIPEQFRVREATPMMDLGMDRFVWPDIIGDSLSLEESTGTSYVSSGFEHGGFGNVDGSYLGFCNIGGQIMNPFVEDGIWDTLMLQKI